MRERILVIEDEEAIRSILRELLVDAGYDVDEAEDGVIGVENSGPVTTRLCCWTLCCPSWTDGLFAP